MRNKKFLFKLGGKIFPAILYIFLKLSKFSIITTISNLKISTKKPTDKTKKFLSVDFFII
ncbi:hypothetical protein EFL44_08840 [Lactococcus cremoris]|uniref:Uncharacterized protein n=1 Tax=Lactococcus cremoris subsp. cremoris TIFN3 TaxID=1234873 RepID=T0VFR6_LACLC|nr:hypothetical protein LLT7_09745 [Lactococcus cremoris subsp. cremoris TIFN7]EQC94836.1 hypothetical protein LLT3_11350 [Lactococcus cremoris subsp. cremoris TIFN3]KZK47661.1 hypothetical protein B40_0229 [Lactococcus cremoris]OAJ96948.1 hypothetical protein A7U61_10375 [Lactococcus lactis]MCT0467193.1 hypothetical protein [Lactococcus cremoris]